MIRIPALIDPHVHFRTPGAEHKEDWMTAAHAAIAGGVTTVFDMPNNTPACITKERLDEKRARIDEQLNAVGIPLRYGLYLGASEGHLEEIQRCKESVCGIKVFLGSSTGDLLIDNLDTFKRICQIAAKNDILVAVHAEDERLIQNNTKTFQHDNTAVSVHSKIRDVAVAKTAVQNAIDMARQYGNWLYILHASTKEEVELVRAAKKEGLSVYLETTPHHLFLTTEAYQTLGTSAQMNPPLRAHSDQEALWEALKDGTIDTIGTDHAPHTKEEKNQPYGKAPSGVPGIENYLALLLNAVNEDRITLDDIIRLTHTNPQKLFRLADNDDHVLVDMEKVKTIRNEDQKTKCGWSPYAGMTLKGWPVQTVVQGVVFDCESGEKVET